MKIIFLILLTLFALLNACLSMQSKTELSKAECWFDENEKPVDRIYPDEKVYIRLKIPGYADGVSFHLFVSFKIHDVYNSDFSGNAVLLDYSSKSDKNSEK